MTHDKFCMMYESTEKLDELFYCDCSWIKDIRADEREQAAQRILAIDDEENNDYWRDGVHEALAAARGDVADKTGESTGGHGGLVSRALFPPSSTAAVHNIDNPDAVVNVRNAAVVNITQAQNVNVWTDAAARGGEHEHSWERLYGEKTHHCECGAYLKDDDYDGEQA